MIRRYEMLFDSLVECGLINDFTDIVDNGDDFHWISFIIILNDGKHLNITINKEWGYIMSIKIINCIDLETKLIEEQEENE